MWPGRHFLSLDTYLRSPSGVLPLQGTCAGRIVTPALRTNGHAPHVLRLVSSRFAQLRGSGGPCVVQARAPDERRWKILVQKRRSKKSERCGPASTAPVRRCPGEGHSYRVISPLRDW